MLSKRLGRLIATTGYADPQLPAVPDGAAHLNDLVETTRLDLENTALPATFMQQQLRESAAQKQIIILDSLLGSIVTTKNAG